MKKDLITLAGMTREELEHLFEVSGRLKADVAHRRGHRWLEGRTLAMIFEKPSLRTRVTFEVGMFQLGGHAVYLAPGDINLGTREPVTDVAANLSRWVDAIMARTFAHESVVDLAAASTVPVINGLSDLYHPCQVLADCFTLVERTGRVEGLKIAYVGDGNNMVHSWLMAAARLGFEFTAVTPAGYEPESSIVEHARSIGGAITVTEDLKGGTRGADVVYTDVWASMGQEDEAEQRRRDFAGYQVDAAVMANAGSDALFMHCLPAHRGEEVSAEVVDGPASLVIEEAENRLHVQKAVMAYLMGAPQAQP